MELFLLEKTKTRFGSYLTLDKNALGFEARRLLQHQYKQTVRFQAVNNDLWPIGRPKWWTLRSAASDPLDQFINIGWKQEFGKWANFLQA